MILVILFSVSAVLFFLEGGHSALADDSVGVAVNHNQVRTWSMEEVDKEIKRRSRPEVYLVRYNKPWTNEILQKYMDYLESEVPNLESRTEYFPMTKNKLRFWIESRPLGIDCEQASKICAARGGHMANIYDQVNHYDLMRRLRMLTGYSGIMTAWTGMSYSNQTGTAYYYGGSPAPFVILHYDAPRPSGLCTSLLVQRDRLSLDQNLRVDSPDALRQGVVCEKFVIDY